MRRALTGQEGLCSGLLLLWLAQAPQQPISSQVLSDHTVHLASLAKCLLRYRLLCWDRHWSSPRSEGAHGPVGEPRTEIPSSLGNQGGLPGGSYSSDGESLQQRQGDQKDEGTLPRNFHHSRQQEAAEGSEQQEGRDGPWGAALNNHVLHGQDTVHWASAAGSHGPHSGEGRRGKRPPPPSGPMGIPWRCLSLGRGLPLQREKWTHGSRNLWGHQGSQGLPGSRSRAWAATLKPGGPGRWPCLRPALPFSLRICTESPKIYPSLRTPSAPQPPG